MSSPEVKAKVRSFFKSHFVWRPFVPNLFTLYILNIFQNQKANFNQSWHKASFCRVNSSLIKNGYVLFQGITSSVVIFSKSSQKFLARKAETWVEASS